MKEYLDRIALIKNSRGVYCLDSSVGCTSGMSNEQGGCYGDCYASKSARTYGYDFKKTVFRDFEDWAHLNDTIRQINSVPLDFIRMGCSGDPSEDWAHTFKILKQIERCNKEIVIITRHWTLMTDEQLASLARKNVCINTSVSALDKSEAISRSVEQYNRIKPFCKSVLRIISCDFNLNNEQGRRLNAIQNILFTNVGTIDTVFRPAKKNRFVTDGIVNVKKELFNGRRQLASKRDKKTYMGKCATCQEMCGFNVAVNEKHEQRRGIIKQQKLW